MLPDAVRHRRFWRLFEEGFDLRSEWLGRAAGARHQPQPEIGGFAKLRIELHGGLAPRHCLRHAGVVIAHQADEAWKRAFQRPLILHLGDRLFVSFGHVAVAMREDSDLDVCFVDKPQ